MEPWHQVRMMYHARSHSLRSIHEQKQNQANNECSVTHPEMTSVISQVNYSTKRKLSDDHASEKVINENKKKASRISPRKQLKNEAQTEERIAIKTPREMLKEEFKVSYVL